MRGKGRIIALLFDRCFWCVNCELPTFCAGGRRSNKTHLLYCVQVLLRETNPRIWYTTYSTLTDIFSIERSCLQVITGSVGDKKWHSQQLTFERDDEPYS